MSDIAKFLNELVDQRRKDVGLTGPKIDYNNLKDPVGIEKAAIEAMIIVGDLNNENVPEEERNNPTYESLVAKGMTDKEIIEKFRNNNK